MKNNFLKIISILLISSLMFSVTSCKSEREPNALPDEIHVSALYEKHCQGITMDTYRDYVYYTFTTEFVKTDLLGNVIGSVTGFIGHLGDITFNPDDGKVYASLEYKRDEVGDSIYEDMGIDPNSIDEGFYIAIFDVDKIDRVGMNAETDGVVKSVYLKSVYDDYSGKTTVNGVEVDHIYGCGGVDAMSVGPDFGAEKNSKNYLMVCYGVYSDKTRTDNDYQIVNKYDLEGLWDIAQPITQTAPHKTGVEAPIDKYFVYTGNTSYGTQNLVYDSYTGDWFAFVYRGGKPQFSNYDVFVIDGSKTPIEAQLKGFPNGTIAKTLTLKEISISDSNGISGMFFTQGDNGTYSAGDGTFMIAEFIINEENLYDVTLVKYTLDTEIPYTFVRYDD